jgi:hypothetical protein
MISRNVCSHQRGIKMLWWLHLIMNGNPTHQSIDEKDLMYYNDHGNNWPQLCENCSRQLDKGCGKGQWYSITWFQRSYTANIFLICFFIEIMLKVTLITHSHNSMKTTLQIFSDFSRRLQTYGLLLVDRETNLNTYNL